MLNNRINLVLGDITKLKVDAIVNAANTSLLGGGGVDGAIHRAAGNQLLDACEKLRGCKTGEAKITAGFNLPASFVIHAVGPIWNGGNNDEENLLKSCYHQSLHVAVQHHLQTIAFPNISTGIYGFPKMLAAQIAVKTVSDFLQSDHQLTNVTFCCFDDENHHIYKDLLAKE